MKNNTLYILATLAACFLFTVDGYSRTAADFFKSAPDKVVRLLSENTRLDMIDYFNFGSNHISSNSFDGPAQIKSLSDASISFDVDRDVNMQIVVLPAKNDTVVAVITTLSSPVPDSKMEFFDTAWTPLRKAPFEMPAYGEWLTKNGKENAAMANMYLPFISVYATFDPEGKTLLLVNQSKKYLDKTEYKLLEPLIVSTKMYDVTQSKFTLRK